MRMIYGLIKIVWKVYNATLKGVIKVVEQSVWSVAVLALNCRRTDRFGLVQVLRILREMSASKPKKALKLNRLMHLNALERRAL